MKKSAYYLFLGTLVFAPLAFGTVETWAYTVLEWLICASALLLFVSKGQSGLYRAPGIFPLLLVSAAILFQAIPLPAEFVRIISPETEQIYRNSAGVLSSANWIPISVHPGSTLKAFLRFSSYVLFYFTAVQFMSDSTLFKKTLWVISLFGALLAMFVIFEFVTKIFNYPLPHEKIMFFRESVHGHSSVGPYVNRNHYAGLMEMIFPLALGLFLIYRPVIARVSFRRRLMDVLLHKRLHSHLLYGSAAILTATSLFVTLSRGGIISMTLSMGFLALFIVFKTSRYKTGLYFGVVIVAVLFFAGTEAWDLIIERFENIRNEYGELATGRPVYWSDSISIYRDFPVFGTGADTFVKIYPKYRTYSGKGLLEHAHNDYLEFLSTGGLAVSGLMLYALIFILQRSFQTYRKRREGFAIYLYPSCLAAVLSILLHSAVDFNMQIGANGLYFFFVLAASVSASHTRFREGLSATYLEPCAIKSSYPQVLASLLLAAGVLFINFGELRGNYHYSDFRNINIDGDISSEKWQPLRQAAEKAAKADPMNPEYRYILAKAYAASKQNEAALRNFSTALLLDPLNSRYLQEAAYFLSDLGKKNDSDQLMRAAIAYDHRNPLTYFNYASWLFQENLTQKGLNVLSSAMETDPSIADDCLALMVWFGLSEKQMHEALPALVLPHLKFADFLVSQGKNEKAESSYMEALRYISGEDSSKKTYLLTIYRFFISKKEYEKALPVIQQALEFFPDDARLHRIAGNLYEKLDLAFRAEEEYRKASILKP